MWGGGIALAYAAQIVVTLAGALIRGAAAPPIGSRPLVIGSVLATPCSLGYDLMGLTPAIACLCAEGSARGFGPYQKTIPAGLWIVPLMARSVPQATLFRQQFQ